MFNVGDRVAITEAYGDPDYTGLIGTVIESSEDSVYPVWVDMDIVTELTDTEVYRSAMFDTDELRLADQESLCSPDDN